jgi:hypothetical protein
MVRPLTYNSGLNLEEAEERYREVSDELERVKKHYSGFFDKFKRNMSKKDQELLADCVGVLLPLRLEDSVQEQICQAGSKEKTLFYKIQLLQFEMLDYQANFKNTGVTRLKGNFEEIGGP